MNILQVENMNKTTCIEQIADHIIAFQKTHGKKPKEIYVSSSLFRLLTDGKGDPARTKFADIKLKVTTGCNNMEYKMVY